MAESITLDNAFSEEPLTLDDAFLDTPTSLDDAFGVEETTLDDAFGVEVENLSARTSAEIISSFNPFGMQQFETKEEGAKVLELVKMKEALWYAPAEAPPEARAASVDQRKKYNKALSSATPEVKQIMERNSMNDRFRVLQRQWAGNPQGMPDGVRRELDDIDEQLNITSEAIEKRVLSGRATTWLDRFNYGRFATHQDQLLAADFNVGSLSTAQSRLEKLADMDIVASQTMPEGKSFLAKAGYGLLGTAGPMAESIALGRVLPQADKLYWATQGQGTIIKNYVTNRNLNLTNMGSDEITRLKAISALGGAVYAAVEYMGSLYGMQGTGLNKAILNKFIGKAMVDDVFFKRFQRGGARFMINWLLENGEEGIQGFVTQLSENIAGGDAEVGKAIDEMWSQFKGAIPTTFGMAIVGGGISSVSDERRINKLSKNLQDRGIDKKQADGDARVLFNSDNKAEWDKNRTEIEKQIGVSKPEDIVRLGDLSARDILTKEEQSEFNDLLSRMSPLDIFDAEQGRLVKDIENLSKTREEVVIPTRETSKSDLVQTAMVLSDLYGRNVSVDEVRDAFVEKLEKVKIESAEEAAKSSKKIVSEFADQVKSWGNGSITTAKIIDSINDINPELADEFRERTTGKNPEPASVVLKDIQNKITKEAQDATDTERDTKVTTVEEGQEAVVADTGRDADETTGQQVAGQEQDAGVVAPSVLGTFKTKSEAEAHIEKLIQTASSSESAKKLLEQSGLATSELWEIKRKGNKFNVVITQKQADAARKQQVAGQEQDAGVEPTVILVDGSQVSPEASTPEKRAWAVEVLGAQMAGQLNADQIDTLIEGTRSATLSVLTATDVLTSISLDGKPGLTISEMSESELIAGIQSLEKSIASFRNESNPDVELIRRTLEKISIRQALHLELGKRKKTPAQPSQAQDVSEAVPTAAQEMRSQAEALEILGGGGDSNAVTVKLIEMYGAEFRRSINEFEAEYGRVPSADDLIYLAGLHTGKNPREVAQRIISELGDPKVTSQEKPSQIEREAAVETTETPTAEKVAPAVREEAAEVVLQPFAPPTTISGLDKNSSYQDVRASFLGSGGRKENTKKSSMLKFLNGSRTKAPTAEVQGDLASLDKIRGNKSNLATAAKKISNFISRGSNLDDMIDKITLGKKGTKLGIDRANLIKARNKSERIRSEIDEWHRENDIGEDLDTLGNKVYSVKIGDKTHKMNLGQLLALKIALQNGDNVKSLSSGQMILGGTQVGNAFVPSGKRTIEYKLDDLIAGINDTVEALGDSERVALNNIEKTYKEFTSDIRPGLIKGAFDSIAERLGLPNRWKPVEGVYYQISFQDKDKSPEIAEYRSGDEVIKYPASNNTMGLLFNPERTGGKGTVKITDLFDVWGRLINETADFAGAGAEIIELGRTLNNETLRRSIRASDSFGQKFLDSLDMKYAQISGTEGRASKSFMNKTANNLITKFTPLRLLNLFTASKMFSSAAYGRYFLTNKRVAMNFALRHGGDKFFDAKIRSDAAINNRWNDERFIAESMLSDPSTAFRKKFKTRSAFQTGVKDLLSFPDRSAIRMIFTAHAYDEMISQGAGTTIEDLKGQPDAFWSGVAEKVNDTIGRSQPSGLPEHTSVTKGQSRGDIVAKLITLYNSQIQRNFNNMDTAVFQYAMDRNPENRKRMVESGITFALYTMMVNTTVNLIRRESFALTEYLMAAAGGFESDDDEAEAWDRLVERSKSNLTKVPKDAVLGILSLHEYSDDLIRGIEKLTSGRYEKDVPLEAIAEREVRYLIDTVTAITKIRKFEKILDEGWEERTVNGEKVDKRITRSRQQQIEKSLERAYSELYGNATQSLGVVSALVNKPIPTKIVEFLNIEDFLAEKTIEAKFKK